MTQSRKPGKNSSGSSGDYRVGYGRPPEATRFKPGQSGNPNGRPKGSKNFDTLFEEELRRPVSLREGGRVQKMPKQRALIKQLVNRALTGNDKSLALVLGQIRYRQGLPEEPSTFRDLTRPEDQAVAANILRRLQLATGSRQDGEGQ